MEQVLAFNKYLVDFYFDFFDFFFSRHINYLSKIISPWTQLEMTCSIKTTIPLSLKNSLFRDILSKINPISKISLINKINPIKGIHKETLSTIIPKAINSILGLLAKEVANISLNTINQIIKTKVIHPT